MGSARSDNHPQSVEAFHEVDRFEQHYSGGNRTRMGLFSMFYGLYAPYWYSFERQRIAPARMEFIRSKNYQLALHTSQSFDYPELRHTLFTGIPRKTCRSEIRRPLETGHKNITDIIGKLERRDRHRPFFGFMFSNRPMRPTPSRKMARARGLPEGLELHQHEPAGERAADPCPLHQCGPSR